jgi:hypothetical protein
VSRHGVGQTFRASVHEELLGPYRTLALRVISVAVRDLISPGQSACERETARTFLSGSPMLTHWCSLADIDPAALRKQMRGVVEVSYVGHPQGKH